jgi:hypothetical protein
MSAPVNGRLELEAGLVVAGATAGDCAGGVVEVAPTVWVTEQVGPDIEPQPLAPATVGTAMTEANAKPEPINKRLAHIMVALPSAGNRSCVPLANPADCCRRLVSQSIMPGVSRIPQRVASHSDPTNTQEV